MLIANSQSETRKFDLIVKKTRNLRVKKYQEHTKQGTDERFRKGNIYLNVSFCTHVGPHKVLPWVMYTYSGKEK